MVEILKMTAFLVLVCAVSAVALAFTNAQTKPLIDEQNRTATELLTLRTRRINGRTDVLDAGQDR